MHCPLGTLKKVNSAEMGNLTGQIMKELQAQGKSEDWTVGFAKMANALYLKVRKGWRAIGPRVLEAIDRL